MPCACLGHYPWGLGALGPCSGTLRWGLLVPCPVMAITRRFTVPCLCRSRDSWSLEVPCPGPDLCSLGVSCFSLGPYLQTLDVSCPCPGTDSWGLGFSTPVMAVTHRVLGLPCTSPGPYPWGSGCPVPVWSMTCRVCGCPAPVLNLTRRVWGYPAPIPVCPNKNMSKKLYTHFFF